MFFAFLYNILLGIIRIHWCFGAKLNILTVNLLQRVWMIVLNGIKDIDKASISFRKHYETTKILNKSKYKSKSPLIIVLILNFFINKFFLSFFLKKINFLIDFLFFSKPLKSQKKNCILIRTNENEGRCLI